MQPQPGNSQPLYHYKKSRRFLYMSMNYGNHMGDLSRKGKTGKHKAWVSIRIMMHNISDIM
ncbi:MAG: hypothetical protein D9N14_12050 [Ketobacter sp.]|nr:MAG: hypothetical protein D9N14_12050 [Ketobacter sp.]